MSLGLSRSLSKLTISPDAPQFATYRYRRYALAMNPLTYIIPDKLKSAYFSHTLGTNVSPIRSDQTRSDIFDELTDMQKKKKRDPLGIMSLKRLSPVEGAVTYSPAFAVPSAWQGLTSLFGMERGGTLALSPP